MYILPTYIHICIQSHTCMCTYTHTYIYIHTNIHTNIHTYITYLLTYVELSLDSSLPYLSKHLCPTSSSLSHLYRLVLCLLLDYLQK